MNFNVLRRKKIGPESLVGVRPAVREEFNSKTPKRTVKGDFPLQHLTGNRLDQFIKHEIGEEPVVLRLRISDPARKMGHFDEKVSAVFEDSVNFPKDAVKVVQVFEDMLGIHLIHGTVLNGIRKLVEIEDDVRPVGEDNVDPKRLLGLVIAAAQIQNHHKEEQYCIIKCPERLAVENWKDQVG